MSIALSEPVEDRLDTLLDTLDQAGSPVRFSERANLRAIHAGREALRAKSGEQVLKWLDPETEGLALGSADLTGVTLSHSVFDGANLRGAVLAKVTGQGVDFSHAVIEAATFSGADLTGARFEAVQGGEADFSGAMLEDSRFAHAALRFANLSHTSLDGADFAEADLWGASLEGTDADEASFRKARLDEANLSHGNFSGVNFAEASLKKANLTRTVLCAADFSGAHLEGAILAGANLSRASLPRLNLLSCDLTHVRLADAWLELTRLQARQFGGAIGEEVAGDYEQARQAYIGLEQNFRTLGNSDDASWAFRKRRTMGKKHQAAEARRALSHRAIWAATGHGVHWVADVFVEWLCDYGESLWRVARAFAVAILGFALMYGVCGALTRAGPNGVRFPTRDPTDYLAYSFLNMLSTSAPDIGLKPLNEGVVIIASVQGAIGIVLIGLFGYVLGNRMHR